MSRGSSRRRQVRRAAGKPGGELRILSAGAGDLKIEFRDDDPPEKVEEARALVEKLLRDGYALLVAMPDGTHARCTGFDPATRSYIVAASPRPVEKRRRGRPPKGERVKASGTRAYAVARSAGG